jgi:hypothetical protein
MNTRLDSDPELLGLVRGADPMLDPRVRADAGLDTESALRLLAPELDRPPAPRRPRRRRGVAYRVARPRDRGGAARRWSQDRLAAEGALSATSSASPTPPTLAPSNRAAVPAARRCSP